MIFTILYFISCVLWATYSAKQTNDLFLCAEYFSAGCVSRTERYVHIIISFVLNFIFMPIGMLFAIFRTN